MLKAVRLAGIEILLLFGAVYLWSSLAVPVFRIRQHSFGPEYRTFPIPYSFLWSFNLKNSVFAASVARKILVVIFFCGQNGNRSRIRIRNTVCRSLYISKKDFHSIILLHATNKNPATET
jgi:hypothetical protein